MKTDLGILIPANAFDAIEATIRERHLVTHMEPVSKAGFMNLVLWTTPYDDETIVLIRGES